MPIAAIIGSRDEYLDRRPEELVEAFKRNATRAGSFSGIVVPGALHGFAGHEDVLARQIVRWIRSQGLIGSTRSAGRSTRRSTNIRH